MTAVAIDKDPYGAYRNRAFSANYNRNNYGEYDANTLGSQGYSGDLIAKDEYGQDYNVGELNLEEFKDRLKTKKSRFTNTERCPIYGELAKRRLGKPTVGNRMWDAYNKTKFDDHFQIGKKYRERSATEIAQEKANAEEMYNLLEKDTTLDHSKKEVQNLMRVVQNRARHVRKHEKNFNYEAMRHLYKILVEGGHKLKFNPSICRTTPYITT
jgi:predicted Zn-ribbon and HTH transcriptional regulator